MYPVKMALVFMMALATISLQAQSFSCFVSSKVHADDQWKSYPTRVLSDFPAAVTGEKDSSLSEFGGLIEHKTKATGFFYATNLDGRWWLVDPNGCLFIDRGVSDVEKVRGIESKQVLAQEFGNETNWAVQTTALLRSNGFNNLGAWSDVGRLRSMAHPLVYTRILNFMSSYGEQRGGTYQQSGHTGYPNNCIFVFYPAFEIFCDVHALQVVQTKNDPWLLGYFSDNEMPLWGGMLTNYLRLPSEDAGYRAASEWLQARHGKPAAIDDVTEQDREDFLAFVVERYYQVVSSAIKKYDPNHLFLGSRFNGRVLNEPEVFKAAGPYLDVVSVNYYDVWTPSQQKIISWEHESGKPVLITEWYTKAEDSGLANTGGAGWIVKTQRDRGLFYQNYTLALLQSRVCVGWDWFKYADNDPTDTTSDPSNRDANKGIVNVHYQPYQPLLEAMRQINERVYSLVTYFDSSAGSVPNKETADNAPIPFTQN